jgi:hypothetical protein
MKRVHLTTADVEHLKRSLPATARVAPTLHHEELAVDGLAFGLARPNSSDDPRTNSYSIAFRCGDADYVIMVRPTVHGVPSITLNIIRKGADAGDPAHFASYILLKDALTTLKGEMPAQAIGQAKGKTGDPLAHLDFRALIAGLKLH